MPRQRLLLKLNVHDIRNGMLSDDETDYRSDIDHFVSWCVAICLELNVVKTKELVKDFGSGVDHPTPVNINGQHIEIVHSYKYMGTKIDDKLRWDDNTMNLNKKSQQRLYFLRKLNVLHIDRHFLFVFHEWQPKSYLAPPTSYTTITTFSPMEGGTEC